ncbi:ribonuclease H-like domain-containing protein [Syncephalis fuscata]|nr:ribonuclease H-like domain-containing protein [Syncephalis fuscata]
MNHSSDITDNFEAYTNSLFGSLVQAVQQANTIPSSEDLSFYRMLNRPLGTTLDTCSGDILDMCNSLLQYVGRPPSDPFEEADDVRERFGDVVDAVDSLLERTDVCLDEMTGKTNERSVITQSAPSLVKMSQPNLDYHLIHAQNIVRPQIRFADKIDNTNHIPFVPKIKTKPNAKVPLGYGMPTLQKAIDDEITETADHLQTHMQSLGIAEGMMSAPHPYEYELKHIEYPTWLFKPVTETPYTLFDDTDAIWVDTPQGLQNMINILSNVTEIAVDLEAHDYRSFQGFTCLMQLSTREQDFIVDTLVLREELHAINVIFSNPNIIKVFHGADSDIVWLQRDFGVYVIGLFDTYQASRILEFERLSLAYLLQKYANVNPDKRYQLADWRIRPLPKEMLLYARSDTHYLLYIFDRLHQELMAKSNPETLNLLHAVLDRSQETALKRYEKEMYDEEHGEGPGGWRTLIAKWNYSLNTVQLAVFRALHAWRDRTARIEDESTRYILPNPMLFSLAQKMPTEAAGVIGCCTPVPPLVRMNATDLAYEIQNARSAAEQQQAERAAKVRAMIQSTDDTSMKAEHIRFDTMQVDQHNDTLMDRELPDVSTLLVEHSQLFGHHAIVWKSTSIKAIDESTEVAQHLPEFSFIPLDQNINEWTVVHH